MSSSRACSSSASSTQEEKISGSGRNHTRVPRRSLSPPRLSGVSTEPRANDSLWCAPSRHTSSRNHWDNAFTQARPTPCSPAEVAYEEWSNLPPECSVVSTSSHAGTPASGCGSVGMPRPSSVTEQEPSSCSSTEIAPQ